MRRLAVLALFALTLPAAAQRREPAYARPDLLLEPADLAKAEKKFTVLDARTKAKYAAGHVPGAVWVDVKGWAKAFASGQEPATWGKRVGALGIDVATPVVVYDDRKANDAARVWWILKYWGVKDVRLLNGGWGGWVKSGGKVEKGENTPTAVVPKLVARPSRLATRDELLEALKARRAPQIIDTRSEGEFCGTVGKAKRLGAIPGAHHLEWSDTIDPKTARFKSAAELTKLFRDAGIDPSRPATTYCQSGGRAAVMAFVLELMSGREARNYYRSWSEWGNSPDTPVARPKGKKE